MVLNSISNKSKLAVPLAFLLALILSLSVYGQAASIFKGNVTIGTNASTDGAVIGAYLGSSTTPKPVRTVGSDGAPSSGYLTTVGCNAGDTVFLKVWGINGTNANLTCVQGGTNYFNLSASLVAADGTCTYSQACSNTNYVCCSGTTEVNDGTTTGATCKSTCAAAATAATDTTQGGGGGGGGGGAAAASESADVGTVSGSTTKTISYAKTADLAVQDIVLTTTSTASIANGKVTVAETTPSSDVSSKIAAGSTKVYKYLSITKVNIKAGDIDKATIKFEVTAKWLKDNNIDPATVKLNRYINDQWVALTTKKVSSDADKYVYEAETAGFSTFAISGEKLPEKLTAFQLIDVIREFYAGTSSYTAFQIIDLIRNFYK